MRLFAIILLSALAAVAQKPASSPTVDSEAEQEILRLLNLERARAGLRSLRADPALQRAARKHSRIMADANQLAHEFGAEPPFNRRMALEGASFAASAENVAFNQTAEGAHRGLMNSPPHRANILNPEYNTVGVGVIRQGDDIWVTQDFARSFQQQTQQEARNAVLAAFQGARRKVRLPPVSLVDEPRLQTIACRMAKEGELDTKAPLTVPGVRATTAYTTSDLTQLPSTALKIAGNPNLHRISVAVCFDKSSKYEAGMNWVSIAAY